MRASALASRGSILTTDIEVLVGCLTVQVQIEGHAPLSLSLLFICLLQSLLSLFLSLSLCLSVSVYVSLSLCLSRMLPGSGGHIVRTLALAVPWAQVTALDPVEAFSEFSQK